MRQIVTILFCGLFLTTKSQDYTDAGVIFELLSEHAKLSEFFDKKDSAFQIIQYKSNEKSDSLEFAGKCIFSFLPNDIIQTKVYKDKKRYWKWIANENGDKYGYIEECNKKGVLKRPNLDFKTFNSKKIEQDSIVDQITFIVNNKDTTCHFLNRFIYHHDTLVEYWNKCVFNNKCSWDDQENIFVHKYSYPDKNTTITETFKGNTKKMDSIGKHTTIEYYNESGKLTSSLLISDNETYETKYFYKNGLWCKTERWQGTKPKLFEMLEKRISNHR